MSLSDELVEAGFGELVAFIWGGKTCILYLCFSHLGTERAKIDCPDQHSFVYKVVEVHRVHCGHMLTGSDNRLHVVPHPPENRCSLYPATSDAACRDCLRRIPDHIFTSYCLRAVRPQSALLAASSQMPLRKMGQAGLFVTGLFFCSLNPTPPRVLIGRCVCLELTQVLSSSITVTQS